MTKHFDSRAPSQPLNETFIINSRARPEEDEKEKNSETKNLKTPKKNLTEQSQTLGSGGKNVSGEILFAFLFSYNLFEFLVRLESDMCNNKQQNDFSRIFS